MIFTPSGITLTNGKEIIIHYFRLKVNYWSEPTDTQSDGSKVRSTVLRTPLHRTIHNSKRTRVALPNWYHLQTFLVFTFPVTSNFSSFDCLFTFDLNYFFFYSLYFSPQDGLGRKNINRKLAKIRNTRK